MDIPIVLPHSFRNPEAESLMHRRLMDELLFAEAGVQVLEHDLMPVDACVLFFFMFQQNGASSLTQLSHCPISASRVDDSIFKPNADALSDVEEWKAIKHGEEDRRVEQGQLDTGPDMGVCVGARRLGMDTDMGRDRGIRGKGVSMGMGKMGKMGKMGMSVHTWSLANSGPPVTMTGRGMPVPIGATHRVATIAGVCRGLRVTKPGPLKCRPLSFRPQRRSSRQLPRRSSRQFVLFQKSGPT